MHDTKIDANFEIFKAVFPIIIQQITNKIFKKNTQTLKPAVIILENEARGELSQKGFVFQTFRFLAKFIPNLGWLNNIGNEADEKSEEGAEALEEGRGGGQRKGMGRRIS